MNIYKKNKQGSAIAYALIIIATLSILLTSVIEFVVVQLKFGYYDESRQEAFEVAEAGMSYYRWYLAHETDGKTAKQLADFWNIGSPLGLTPTTVEYRDPWSGNAIGQYMITVTKPEDGSTIATAAIEGWTYKYPTIKRRIKVRFRRSSWSEYMVLSDSDIGFGSGRIINGKIHSNGGIRFDGDYISDVASSSKFYGYIDPDYGHRAYGVHIDNPIANKDPEPPAVVPDPPVEPPLQPDIFRGGRKYAPVKNFANVKADMALMKTDASVLYESADEVAADSLGRHITLKADGDFTICRVVTAKKDKYKADGETLLVVGTKDFTEDSCQTKTIPDDGIIYIENDVWIDGTLSSKRVTVVANNPKTPLTTSEKFNIFIGQGNLLYADMNGREILGLVAQNNIEIIKDSQNDLIIDAALLAVDGKVFKNTHCSQKNSVTINGAIATYLRYSFSRGSPCGGSYSGYQFANFNFDGRLMDTPPPYFPTGLQYLMDLWEEV